MTIAELLGIGAPTLHPDHSSELVVAFIHQAERHSSERVCTTHSLTGAIPGVQFRFVPNLSFKGCSIYGILKDLILSVSKTSGRYDTLTTDSA